jgi:quercetin dioxygenase-like cupin family protein
MIIKAKDVQPVSRHPGISSRSLINGDTPSAAVTMSELTLEPGALLGKHTHNAEEAFYIFEGSGIALVDDEEFPVEAGAAILASTGVMHGFRNNTDKPLKFICFYPVIFPKSFRPGS